MCFFFQNFYIIMIIFTFAFWFFHSFLFFFFLFLLDQFFHFFWSTKNRYVQSISKPTRCERYPILTLPFFFLNFPVFFLFSSSNLSIFIHSTDLGYAEDIQTSQIGQDLLPSQPVQKLPDDMYARAWYSKVKHYQL